MYIFSFYIQNVCNVWDYRIFKPMKLKLVFFSSSLGNAYRFTLKFYIFSIIYNLLTLFIFVNKYKVFIPDEIRFHSLKCNHNQNFRI